MQWPGAAVNMFQFFIWLFTVQTTPLLFCFGRMKSEKFKKRRCYFSTRKKPLVNGKKTIVNHPQLQKYFGTTQLPLEEKINYLIEKSR
jgi:hypothetical protein